MIVSASGFDIVCRRKPASIRLEDEGSTIVPLKTHVYL